MVGDAREQREGRVIGIMSIRNREQLMIMAGVGATAILSVMFFAIADYERGVDHCPEHDLHCFMDPVPIWPVVIALFVVAIGVTVRVVVER